MSGSEFQDTSSSIQTPPYVGFNMCKSQMELPAVHTSMDSLHAFDNSSISHSERFDIALDFGYQNEPNTQSPCHVSPTNITDGTSKRKHNSECGSLSETEQHNPPKSKQIKSSSSMKLACPFFQRDPTKFTCRQACSGPGFSSISRLKEHLYRVHKQPDHQCIRCYSTFESRDLLEEHQRAEVPCEKSVNNVSDGITEAQCTRLRKKPSGQPSAVEQWKRIYGILFPGYSVIPSCYYESQDITASTAKNCSLDLKQVKNAMIEGVQKDLKDRFDQGFEKELKDKILLVVKQGMERTIKLLEENEGTNFPTQTLQTWSPEDFGLEPWPLEFDPDLDLDFQSYGSAIGGSQYMMNQDLMVNCCHNSPGSCSSLQILPFS